MTHNSYYQQKSHISGNDTDKLQQLMQLQNQRGQSMGSTGSVLTGFNAKRREFNESFSTMSRGMLIPDHILLRQK